MFFKLAVDVKARGRQIETAWWMLPDLPSKSAKKTLTCACLKFVRPSSNCWHSFIFYIEFTCPGIDRKLLCSASSPDLPIVYPILGVDDKVPENNHEHGGLT